MKACIEIRPARKRDAKSIVRLNKATGLAHLKIYGCSGVVRFVEDQIETQAWSQEGYTVATLDKQVVGCAVIRFLTHAAFLNYISVVSTVRRTGLGRGLLRHVVSAVRRAGYRTLKLDVDKGNVAARSWYEQLTFETESVTEWWEVPLRSKEDSPCLVLDYPQAQACQQRFGFSQLSLQTPIGRYTVGRLGARWFRIMEPAALVDPGVAAALVRLDSSRRVLAIVREGSMPTKVRKAARLLNRSVRMRVAVARVDRLLAGKD